MNFISKYTYLSNSILTLDNREDSFLLNWRRLNETVTVDSSEYSFFKSHIVEALNYIIPVGDEFFFVYKQNRFIYVMMINYLLMTNMA